MWCIINLTWSEDEGCRSRVEVFGAFGVQRCLGKLAVEDPNMDVRDRASTALLNITGAGVGMEPTRSPLSTM